MKFQDVLRLTVGTVRANRLRTILTMLGIAIGTASVILLTSIGEGLRIFILEQYTQFGTNLLGLHPGKAQTFGLPSIANTTRKLTLEDLEPLSRLHGVEKVVPVAYGSARVEANNRARSVFVYGVTSDALEAWRFHLLQGSFLPPGDPRRAPPLAVLGTKLKTELFGSQNALGQHVRIGGRRFVVIGTTEPKGQFLGVDLDDIAYIPVNLALKLFNKEGLQEIHIVFSQSQKPSTMADRVGTLMKERHQGEEDFTIISQTEMLESLDKILGIMTAAVGAIAAISLLVGAVGILTMMWISVNERVNEIGLEKAIGAQPYQILILFLGEAGLLSTAGGVAGIAVGLGMAELLSLFVPALPVRIPTVYVLLSIIVSLAVGIASGVLPARRAAQLEPMDALRTE